MHTFHRIYQYINNNSPIRINLILVGLALYILYTIAFTANPQSLSTEEPLAQEQSIAVFLARYTFIILASLASLACITNIGAWLWCKYSISQYSNQVKLTVEDTKNNHAFLKIEFPRLLQPILGFVKGYLAYNQKTIPTAFIFKRKKFFAITKPVALQTIVLEDITTYQFHSLQLYFSDMFRLLLLRTKQPINYTYYNPPKQLPIEIEDVNYSTSIIEDEIIKLKKTNEGDYLNYKTFEAGDDVRRIVWKLYAKNKELIIRTPDLEYKNKPNYQILASFYTTLHLEDAVATKFLNHYKNNIWTIVEHFEQQEISLRYKNDNTDSIINQSDIAATITQQEWQVLHTAASIIDNKKDNIIILSSISDPNDLTSIIHASTTATIYFIKLSETLKGNILLHWLRKIFFVGASDRANLYSNYRTTNQRKQVINNENMLLQILQTNGKYYHIL